MKNYELIKRGEKISIIDTETEEITTLPQATQIMALALYKKYEEWISAGEDRKKELEEDISFQSLILDSMAKACNSTENARRL